MICAQAMVYLLNRLWWILIRCLSPRTKNQEPKQKWSKRTQDMCLRLALSTSNVVEVALIALYHPMTLLHGLKFTEPFPERRQLCTQLFVFFVVDGLLHWCVFSKVRPPKSKQTPIDCTRQAKVASFRIAADFMTPRGTVIVATTLVGSPSLLGAISGRLHFASIVTWMALRQVQFGDGSPHEIFHWSITRHDLPLSKSFNWIYRVMTLHPPRLIDSPQDLFKSRKGLYIFASSTTTQN